MSALAYTLAMYRVREGREESFISVWNELAETFARLPQPPLWGTLIRHQTDRSLFYSFGPWQSAAHVAAMRTNAQVAAAFSKLRELCTEMTPGNYDMIRHVDVAESGSLTIVD